MNIGFYLLDISQTDNYTINILNNINSLCKLRPQDNIVVFNNNFDAIDHEQKYYTLSMNHAKYFSGVLFLFSTQHALFTKTFPCPSKQILYLDKPEWAENHSIPFTIWNNIYMDQKYEIICSSQELGDIFSICWKKPLANIANFNYQDINNVILRL